MNSFCHELDIESCGLVLKNTERLIIVVSGYRSPDGNMNNFLFPLDLALNSLGKVNKTLVLCGDVNIQLNIRLSRLFCIQVSPTESRPVHHQPGTDPWEILPQHHRYNIQCVRLLWTENPIIADHYAVEMCLLQRVSDS